VAQTYLTLRATDRQRAVVRRSLALRREARELIRSRVRAGTAPELDEARVETEVASAEAELARLDRSRHSLEMALAILTGTPAPEFHLAETAPAPAPTPVIPAGLPSELLERRPDVAAAERRLAAANARIGVARAAFFPVLRLTGSAGFVSAELDSLFQWDSRVWTLGPSVSLPLFTGGRNRANLSRARAEFEAAVADYRQRVLVAFGEVQDALTALKFLAGEAAAMDRMQNAAQRVADLARARYDAGIVSYLEVIEAQRTLLDTQLAVARLDGQQQVLVVQLIKALGGGWDRPTAATAAAPPASLP
jgi:multidrug efflux system outer membrane protein